MKRLRLSRPSPALIVSVIALLVALGGTGYAAFKVPKNSVGSKQLKKNAVTTKKIKNLAVTSSKINTSGLTVPNALHANSADNATNAGTANTANTANNIAAPEGFHVVGAAGEPVFQHGCHDIGGMFQPVAFYKDRESRVHLQGALACPSSGSIAFQLPPGDRPSSNTVILEPAISSNVEIAGPGFGSGTEGAVIITSTATDTSGVSFRPGA